MKNLIIFGSHIPSPKYLNIGDEILNMVQEFLPNPSIYVGVNNSCDEWLEKINNYKYSITPNNLLVKSDASSYQSALRSFVESKDNTEYDNVFFLHTQGVKSKRHDVRRFHLDVLLKNYEDVISALYSDKQNGIYGATITPLTRQKNVDSCTIYKALDRYYNFKYKPFTYFYIGTMFVIKFHILKSFLDNCDKSFFYKSICTEHTHDGKTDMWFFERDFPQIVFKQGYFPTFKFLYNNYQLPNFNEDEYKKDLNFWKDSLNEIL